MSKEDRQQEQLKNVSGGAQPGGTHWGQQPGDANTQSDKDAERAKSKGEKAK